MGVNDELPFQIETVIAAVQRGETEKFRLIVREYGLLVRGYLAARLPHQDDADDLAQEVFLIAFEKLASCDPPRFAGWLLGIARNQLRNHWRARARREDALARFREETLELVDPELETLSAGSSPARSSGSSTASPCSRTASGVSCGRDSRGTRSSTLAEELGINPNALYQARFRAHAALRKCMTAPGAATSPLVSDEP